MNVLVRYLALGDSYTIGEGASLQLNGSGRILIRPSGTEPVIRVMAEAETDAMVQFVVDELCEVITRAIPPEVA